jgi:sugar/nucleoside kinase (ribokinase family)
MTALYDVAALGNAIVDVIASASDDFLEREGLVKGSMMLVDAEQSAALYSRMGSGIETSGGSAGNTIAGVASLGGRGAFIGKVANDTLGEVYAHDMAAIGASFHGGRLIGGAGTGRCMINVTPDGQRTMCTYLGAATELSPADVDPKVIEGAAITYFEGYLFDPEEARRAFAKAAGLARAAGRTIALSVSDSFVVHRHRAALLGFIETEVDVLFANEDEIIALTGEANFADASEAIRDKVKIAALTCGAQGSVVIAGNTTHQIDADHVEKVVDTTGAGDQYAAGFLHALVQGRPLDQCGRLGGLAAGEVINHVGPRPQVSLKDLAAKAGL